MKKAILFIFASLFLFILAGLAYVNSLPAHFVLERKATIAAKPEKIRPLVDDFQNWAKWSPWAHIDPNVKNTISTPSSGVGATFGWVGNDEVGSGSMKILAVNPEDTQIELKFEKPFQATNLDVFRFQSQGDKTLVTWRMEGDNDFAGKLFGFIFNMDKTVGADFDKGLANLAKESEKP
jgi:hypothetical protein